MQATDKSVAETRIGLWRQRIESICGWLVLEKAINGAGNSDFYIWAV
jgi:hypothetical protein